jgi:hypothetical protein
VSLAPDFIEPVIGFRQWRLAGDELCSLNCDERWTTATREAHCLVADHGDETAPVGDCTCGLYAWYVPRPRTSAAGTRDYVSGAVVLWGEIEMHVTGMRAQFCRVVALELPLYGRKRARVLAAARALGVAAVPHRALRAAAAEHGAELTQTQHPRSVPVVAGPWPGTRAWAR